MTLSGEGVPPASASIDVTPTLPSGLPSGLSSGSPSGLPSGSSCGVIPSCSLLSSSSVQLGSNVQMTARGRGPATISPDGQSSERATSAGPGVVSSGGMGSGSMGSGSSSPRPSTAGTSEAVGTVGAFVAQVAGFSPDSTTAAAAHAAAAHAPVRSVTIGLDELVEAGVCVPHLSVDSAWCRQGNEVLVWIPGYNACPADISIALAQLLALGSFPSYIKPFIFAWPNGRELSYPLAANLAETERMQKDMTSFFASVLEAGIEHIHVLAHSMGARLFAAALPSISSLFASRGASLASCIFLNADHPIERFKSVDYPILRQMCSHITIYADQNDRALWYSHVVNTFVPSWAVCSPLGRYPYGFTQGDDRSTMWEQLRVETKEDLDLDVVDTSLLGTNVHGLRHAYFNLNSFIVDDLAEILTMRKRACSRLKLTHCAGNVWTFLAAPAHVAAV
eukprot:CAMPEP_0174702142 /NCGR_PEP_ID=MMETSP1094-20130205/6526_1 /TAXON_ID=156173 /ORGANISM="Chrysochromulina brevifilum, Strain UTEX LB 985" /LENGTH=449 /DNA_ID=CAMNT_0015899879 /DNA_START=86 /DNA_END=1435 /DNA_ORIENTATION=-